MAFPRALLVRALPVAVAASSALLLCVAPPAAAETVGVSPTGSVLVTARGNGHGHGMSQYGARGAAIAGLSAAQITGFYYPHTRLTRLHWSKIRVRLSGFGWTVTVSAAPTLRVRNVGVVGHLAGMAKWRLLADSGSTFTLEYLRSAHGSKWTTYRTHLPRGTRFRNLDGSAVRVWRPDGSSVAYLGRVRVARNAPSGAHGTYPVNRVGLDRYTAGVTPREMPASWETAAVRAQAIAARTYGRYAVEHARSDRPYDICDTTSCQVYGGHVAYYASGAVQWNDFWPAAAATANEVRTYGGGAIFAQFSASDGGASSSGGQPYLIAHADPYDNAASGDPYLSYTRTVRAAALARSFGLATLTRITITSRDGSGAWGGRVAAGYLDGTDSAHHARRVPVSGYDLQYAFGLGTTLFSVAGG